MRGRAAAALQAAALGLVALLAAPAARAGAAPVEVAADALGPALRQGCPAARLQPVQALQGCGPAGCGSWLGPLFVDADGGGLRRSGRALPLVPSGPPPAADLPELNWTPLRAFSVRQGRSTWGQCLEFAHAGLGSSGHGQRWRSVLLLPAAGRSAWRVTGYQLDCDALCTGPGAAQVQLPAVQPVVLGEPALHIVWHRCTAAGCVRQADPRSVDGRADSDSGALRLGP